MKAEKIAGAIVERRVILTRLATVAAQPTIYLHDLCLHFNYSWMPRALNCPQKYHSMLSRSL